MNTRSMMICSTVLQYNVHLRIVRHSHRSRMFWCVCVCVWDRTIHICNEWRLCTGRLAVLLHPILSSKFISFYFISLIASYLECITIFDKILCLVCRSVRIFGASHIHIYIYVCVRLYLLVSKCGMFI